MPTGQIGLQRCSAALSMSPRTGSPPPGGDPEFLYHWTEVSLLIAVGAGAFTWRGKQTS